MKNLFKVSEKNNLWILRINQIMSFIQDLFDLVYGYLVGIKIMWGKKKPFPDKPLEEKVTVPDCSNLKLK